MHLKEIFSNFGNVVKVTIQPVILGSYRLIALIQFDTRKGAENAVDHMHEGQLDGLDIFVRLNDEKKEPENRKKIDQV